MADDDAQVHWRGRPNLRSSENGVQKMEVDEDYDYEKEVAAGRLKKKSKSKKNRVIDLTKVKQDDENAAVPAKAKQQRRKKVRAEPGLDSPTVPKVEAPDNDIEPLLTCHTPEQLRDMALAFVRSSYIRKSGHVQPKLAQNPILLELHQKYTTLEASADPELDIQLLTLYADVVKKSAANLELLKYFIYLVYHDDFKTTRDETFNTFYSGFRNRAFTQLSDAITKCGVVQPDYNLVVDVTKGIETLKANRTKILDDEIEEAIKTTCCQVCLKPATHYCCPGGTYCSVTCYELDGDHRVECTEEPIAAPLMVCARKNNRATYKKRLKASKLAEMPMLFKRAG
uniref:MYND-type domain-containing protein n=1 Tax=Panagrellus redivivus TaxID=6233 RepID=A0A7E4V022_PANRE